MAVLTPWGRRQKPSFSLAQKAPEEWHQQDVEFQRSAVLVRFFCGQSKTTVDKCCASVFSDTDHCSYNITRKKGNDNARLLFHSRSACQQFVAASSGKGLLRATDNPLVV